jgi:uncharacterized membrane protein
MSLATVFISGREWLVPAAVFFGFVALLLFWSYRNSPLRGSLLAACISLKALGVLALALCLLEPLWSGKRARPGANFFAVLVDNSQSMQVKDRGQKLSRGEAIRHSLLQNESSWQTKISEDFQVRRFIFDSALRETADWQELTFEGRASALGKATRAIAERFKGQPLAGILVISDGNATDSLENQALGAPVYPVLVGEDQPVNDIAIQNVSATQTAFEDAPVSLQADVTAVGYVGQLVAAQVFESAPRSRQTNAPRSKLVAEQTQRVRRDGEAIPFRFQLRPTEQGVIFYSIRVGAQSQMGQFENPALVSEVTLANNTRQVEINRGGGPFRVLYVSGRPNWEYKFLNRALEEDPQVQLVGLIRIAKREPKFEFRARVGESSNPLFRGFDRKTEETERYDQPVLVRLNTRDENELRGGFPKTAEELYAFDALILDDLEAEFFNGDQATLVQKFVSERGGGFLMLGGTESFQKGKYHRTPIGDMMPVYLDQVPESPPPKDLRLRLTREGWLQPWARLRATEDDEKFRLGEMPPFQVFNRTRGVKPGASVIATVTDVNGSAVPALAVQRFGHGRAGALMIGDFWRWGLAREDMQHDLAKAWRQLVRWLVADVPQRLEFQVQTDLENADLQIRARDEKFQPLENANVSVHVRELGQGKSIHLDAQAADSEPGLYHATFVSRQPGGYYAEAVATNATGGWAGNAVSGWVSDMAEEEFRSLKPNRNALEQVAKSTGGEIVAWEKIDKFVETLPRRNAPVSESWTTPLWHKAGVFLFALCCFAAEWGLRRWKGLA